MDKDIILIVFATLVAWRWTDRFLWIRLVGRQAEQILGLQQRSVWSQARGVIPCEIEHWRQALRGLRVRWNG